MSSIESTANKLGDELDLGLIGSGLSEWRAGSRRFRVGLTGDTEIEVMTVISRAIPSPVWTVDFGLELISCTVNQWLREHMVDYSDEHRVAESSLSRLQKVSVDLESCLRDVQGVQRLVSRLQFELSLLSSRIFTFEGFLEVVDFDDISPMWSLTFEGRIAINAITGNMSEALRRARHSIDLLRKEGRPDHVIRYYESIVARFGSVH